MAGQSRRLCGSGPCRDFRVVGAGLVLERCRPAALRDSEASGRPGLSTDMADERLIADLLITPGPGEWRAAWVENDEALELYVERGDTRPAGSRHLGRVVRIVPALDAALVDIGEERPGFLPMRNVPEGMQAEEGARLIVEVRREAWQDKAPRLTPRMEGLIKPSAPPQFAPPPP